MQIFIKRDETVFKFSSLNTNFIRHFINTHFKDKKVYNDSILIRYSSDTDDFWVKVLLKWLYSLYTKQNKIIDKNLEKTILQRFSKPIRLVFSKDIYTTISWRFFDEGKVTFSISPKNVFILSRIKDFLQTKIEITQDALHAKLDEDKKYLIKELLKNKTLIKEPHKHRYSKKELEKFLQKDEKLIYAYKTLDVSSKHDIKSIKRRYKELAKMYHPDTVKQTDEDMIELYTKKFQEISQAYEILCANFQNKIAM